MSLVSGKAEGQMDPARVGFDRKSRCDLSLDDDTDRDTLRQEDEDVRCVALAAPLTLVHVVIANISKRVRVQRWCHHLCELSDE
jgi:hypothetical protein|tara:strand:+ start:6802 stop:7053 length:252 start_codon:yes stop_codon:yes gene_type:complete